MRHVTTSKLPSANGRSSARATTSGCIPGAGSTVTTVQPSSRRRRATWPPPVATSSTFTSWPGSHHSTSTSRSGPSRCVGLSRNASARCDQTSFTLPAPRLVEQLPPLVGVRAVQTDDDRQLDLHLLERGQDPARHLVAARDAA